MTIKEKIQPYVDKGFSISEISNITGYNCRTIYLAINPEKREKINKNELPVEVVKKGWNKDRHGCKTCRFRGRAHIYGVSSLGGCDFSCIAGSVRGCKVEDCNRYVKGSRIRANANVVWDEGRSVEYE